MRENEIRKPASLRFSARPFKVSSTQSSAVLYFGLSGGYHELNQQTFNFASTGGLGFSSETSMTVSGEEKKLSNCFRYGRKGHQTDDCHSCNTKTCFNCGQKSHRTCSAFRMKKQQLTSRCWVPVESAASTHLRFSSRSELSRLDEVT